MFNLTQQERQVILFLIIVALVGAGINFLSKKYAPVKVLGSFTEDIGKIDLNKADRDLLMSIPGLGEKLTQRIIKYREQQAGFKEIEELKSIKGITDYKYERIKNYLILK
jgi:competence protein ComEA